jgi:hypothetical protein
MGANSLKVVEPIFDECGSGMGNLLKHQLTTPLSLSRPNVAQNATMQNAEILCGGPHKISYVHSRPSGIFVTGRHSIDSTNVAV